MKKLLILAGLILTLSACDERHLTYYEYNGMTITQFDECADTYFYYGKYKRLKDCPDSYIMLYHRGPSSDTDGFVIFDKDSITIMHTLGLAEEHNADKHMKLLGYGYMPNNEFIAWKNLIQGNYNNIARITNMSMKKDYNYDDNEFNNSKVKITYIR